MIRLGEEGFLCKRRLKLLILARKNTERIQVDFNGTKVWITVVELRPHVVRLGFDAPSEVKIFREELLTDEQRG